MHENHRARVRERYFEEGIDNMPEHNVLEMLLFYCVPRKDTNELAHALMDTFGSLAGVLEAPRDRLMQVDGIGESAAAFLTMIPQICKRYMTEKCSAQKLNLASSEEVMEFGRSLYVGCRTEVFYMLCFDGNGKLTNSCKVGSGSINNVALNKRGLLDMAFRSNAHSVIFVHNHPDSVAAPSRSDVNTTVELISLFSAVSISVVDHIIVGADNVLSMSKTERFKTLFCI